jgi:hypothetical protein
MDLHLFYVLRGLVTMSTQSKQKTAVSVYQPFKLLFVSRLLQIQLLVFKMNSRGKLKAQSKEHSVV